MPGEKNRGFYRRAYVFRKFNKGKNRVFLSILCVLALFMSSGVAGITGGGPQDECPQKEGPQNEGWQILAVSRVFPADLWVAYDGLLQKSNFILLSKLMTLFLRDNKKGYLVEEVEEGLFTVRSRKTVREGSLIRIEEMGGGVFRFQGRLVLKKGFTFSCRIRVDNRYYLDGDELKCETTVAYIVPPVVKAVDETVSFFTGQTFVAYKVLGFVEGLFGTIEVLARLDPAQWREISVDRELLSSLVYPVSFSPQESAIVEEVLKRVHTRAHGGVDVNKAGEF
ncbi:MAG: hypothetical protein GX085_02230 [Firmicutes bacterium]|nr:hypothetical protein [Bacillota bacterium]